MARKVVVQRPKDTFSECDLVIDGEDMSFQVGSGRKFLISTFSQLLYEGGEISPEELKLGSKATIKVTSQGLIDRADITFLNRKPTLLQLFNEHPGIFAAHKYSIQLLASIFKNEPEKSPGVNFLTQKFLAIRKVGNEGILGFFTAVGLAYLEFLMLPCVDVSEFQKLINKVHSLEQNGFMSYLEILWNAKYAGNGNDTLEKFNNDQVFQDSLVKTIQGLLIAYAKSHPENETVGMATLDGIDALKSHFDFNNELTQEDTALCPLALGVQLTIYDSYELPKLGVHYSCDESEGPVPKIALLSKTNTFCILYTKAHCVCEGFDGSLSRRTQSFTMPSNATIQCLYYTPKKKELVESKAPKLEYDEQVGEVGNHVKLETMLQQLIDNTFIELERRALKQGVNFFSDEVIMWTYQTKADYKKKITALKSKLPIPEWEQSLVLLENSPSFNNTAVMKPCSKCDEHTGSMVLACKHFLCRDCFTVYLNETHQKYGRLLEPDGNAMKEFVCPINSCVSAETISSTIIKDYLGAQYDAYLLEAENMVMKKKCTKCSTVLIKEMFFLTDSCGCKVCAYCLVELVGSNNGVCLCNSYISPAAIQKASQYMIRCSTCGREKSLINEFTPVKCADHMSCRKCLTTIVQSKEIRCSQCYRYFADYEVQQVKLYSKKQCMLYCPKYLDPEDLVKTNCDCAYCLDCVKVAARSYNYRNGCFLCCTPFPKETSDMFDKAYYEFIVVATIKQDFFLFKAESCKICLNPIGRVQKTTLACAHAFHLQCLKEYASNFVSTDFQDVMPCPDGQCRKEIDPNLLQQSFLSPQEYDKYAMKLVRIRFNLVQCPNCNFEFEFVRNEGRELEGVLCHPCQYRFCRECKQQWTDDHNPRICRHQTILELIANLEADAGGDPNKHVSQCPGCQTPYLKDDHCDHVKCVNPGCVEWCFTCSALRAPTMEHHNMWHRPDCPKYAIVEQDNEPKREKCPECKRLGRRCDPPPKLKVPTRFDLDEYPDFTGKV